MQITTIDPDAEIHMTDDELALALGRPEGTKPTVLVAELLDRTEGRIWSAEPARGVTRLG